MRNRSFLLLVAALAVACSAVRANADPLLGFVTVPGGMAHDDLGPDPRILGMALNHSGATVVRAESGEIEHVSLEGRLGVGYLHHGVSDNTILRYNQHGYFDFIFENEPDGTGGVNPNWARDYMDRLKATYPRVKAIDSRNRIIGGNLAGATFQPLYDYGLKGNSDIIGLHNYSNDPSNGLNIDPVKWTRDQMTSRGDGSKKIFLGEGWGPMRELPGLKRLFPDARITPQELQMLRDFVVNGYWTLVTPRGNYDPNWVLGGLFFTLNDNWGGRHWADRAVPVMDGSGNVLTYFVDGYNVGLDIFPHFYNGGLIDVYGNAKDNLMDIFPGRGLALANSGFEYFETRSATGTASSWQPNLSSPGRFAVDASIRRSGKHSQRVNLLGDGSASYLTQTSLKGSITPGKTYTISGWVSTFAVVRGPLPGAFMRFEFLSSNGTVIGNSPIIGGLDGNRDWQHFEVSATAPQGADRVRVYCGLYGTSGRAWFDDVIIYEGTSGKTSTLTGFVLDEQRSAVPGATVSTTVGGYSGVTDAQGRFEITGVLGGVYDVVASAEGYRQMEASAQLAIPGKTRGLGFSLAKQVSGYPTGLQAYDPEVGALLKLTWQQPSGPYDAVRIYRSTDPAQIGSLVHEGDLGNSLWDTGLLDGTKYSYTIRAIHNGVESDNTQRTYGIPSGGVLTQAYSHYSSAQWGHFGGDFGQTFRATSTGSLASASCTPGFGGGGGATLTFSIHEGGPDGPQVGPSRSKAAGGDSECTVTWNGGEVPVVQGQTYYLRVQGSAGFAAYRGSDVYPHGRFYISGDPSNSDMWSTITIAEANGVIIRNITSEAGPGGSAIVRWETNAPSAGHVEYGLNESYGSSTPTQQELATEHTAVLAGLTPGERYHFRVHALRPGNPTTISLDYVLTAPEAGSPVSLADAIAAADGTALLTQGVVSATFNGFFYIQNPDRSSGIRVTGDAASLAVGDLIQVAGWAGKAPSGERQIDLAGAVKAGTAEVRPLGMSTSVLGGVASGGNGGQPGVGAAAGLSNVGLLVCVWGTVTSVDTGAFYLDDGSGLSAGEGRSGVRVSIPGSVPAVGSYVRVTGISSCWEQGEALLPHVLVSRPEDVALIKAP